MGLPFTQMRLAGHREAPMRPEFLAGHSRAEKCEIEEKLGKLGLDPRVEGGYACRVQDGQAGIWAFADPEVGGEHAGLDVWEGTLSASDGMACCAESPITAHRPTTTTREREGPAWPSRE